MTDSRETTKTNNSLEERKVKALEGIRSSVRWLPMAIIFASVVNGCMGPSSIGVVVLDGKDLQTQPHQQMPDLQPMIPKSRAPIYTAWPTPPLGPSL